jgi:hypothetical protein
MTGQDERESLLGRWARRKQAAKADTAAAPPPAVEPPAPNEEELAAKLATLPKIEDVTAATDIKVFLESWVPDGLRNAALRKVWASDPHISTFIETADYQWDWTVPGGAPGSGPLDPGFNAERFIAEMFEHRAGAVRADNGVRDAESQPHAAVEAPRSFGDAALQHSAATAPRGSDVHLRKNRDESPDEPERAEDLRAGSLDQGGRDDFQGDHGDFAAQQEPGQNAAESAAKRRRHGGALPICPEK